MTHSDSNFLPSQEIAYRRFIIVIFNELNKIITCAMVYFLTPVVQVLIKKIIIINNNNIFFFF